MIDVTYNEERAAKYAPEEYGICPLHQVGQIFYSNGWEIPSGLCDNAWSCMKDYVLAISQGAGYIYREPAISMAREDSPTEKVWSSSPAMMVSDR